MHLHYLAFHDQGMKTHDDCLFDKKSLFQASSPGCTASGDHGVAVSLTLPTLYGQVSLRHGTLHMALSCYQTFIQMQLIKDLVAHVLVSVHL